MALYDPDLGDTLIGRIVDELFVGDDGEVKKLKGMTLNLHDFMSAYTALGDKRSPLTDTLYGINHALNSGTPTGLNTSRALKSLTFLTRPQFNMTTRNIMADRKMTHLLSNIPASSQRYVRLTLDPRLGTLGDNGVILESPLVDNNNPFISLLTNTRVSITGWPDSIVPTHTSAPGVYKEESIMVDGITDFQGRFELDLTFRRVEDDPIMKLFTTWGRYPSLTYRGIMQPYYDFIRADEYDYNTRIYQLMLSDDGKYVKEIASTGASFPIAMNDGGVFNFDSVEDPYDDGGETSSFRFASVGAIYNDPITVLNFNLVTTYFHPGMKLMNQGRRGHGMVKIPQELMKALNNRGYPRIDLNTLELEWYLEKEIIDAKVKELEDNDIEGISNGFPDFYISDAIDAISNEFSDFGTADNNGAF